MRRAICSAWLDFPRTGAGAGAFGPGTGAWVEIMETLCVGAGIDTGLGATGDGAATFTAEAAVVDVPIGTLTSSSDSPDDESSPPISNRSMLFPLMVRDDDLWL